jgi:hypothetical protein
MPCPYTLRPFDSAAQGTPLWLYLLSIVLFVTFVVQCLLRFWCGSALVALCG